MIVLGTSAAVEWLLVRDSAEEITERLRDPDVSVHAPSFLGIEVASAIRGLVRRRHASQERASTALADLAATDIAPHDPSPLLPRVWQLRDNLTPYDAAYVALAEVLGATLITMDARISRPPGLDAEIDVVSRTCP